MIALQVLGYLVFIPLVWQLGNLLVRLLLDKCSPGVAGLNIQPAELNVGRYIGLLERVLIVVGILRGSWEVMAAVIALKTVARYKDLDEQITAEYFLVGSLASILWALVIAYLFSLYDHAYGFQLLGQNSASP
ncbi:MAG TPA: hypothetical protein VG889_04555 [Rhizomicrobium sp.]|nr:hypothetical protein [Rhizomicrobium sp.]